MALITFEGFDAWVTGTGILADVINSGQYIGWTGGTGGSTSAGNLGGKQWESNGGGNNTIFHSWPASQVTFIIGCRLRIPVVTGLLSCIYFYDNAGTTQIGICITASAKLAVYRTSTATILATGTTTIVAGAYYYVELQATINSSTGSFILKLNGNTEVSASNVNTQASGNANASGIAWNFFSASSMGVDDYYLCDTTGPAPFNSFLCDPVNSLRVETLFPTLNNSVAFTPNAGTNVSQIQETNSDNDTTYNSTPVPAIDIFSVGPLSSPPQTIYAVNVMAKFRTDDVANMTFRTKLLSGATTANGTTWLGSTVYQYIKDQYTTEPSTGNVWSPTTVNNCLIGYERIT